MAAALAAVAATPAHAVQVDTNGKLEISADDGGAAQREIQARRDLLL